MTFGIVAVIFADGNKLNILIQCHRLQPRITISIDIDPIDLFPDEEKKYQHFEGAKKKTTMILTNEHLTLWSIMCYVITLTGSVFFDIKNRFIGGLWSMRRMAPVCWFGSIALTVPFCTNLFVMKCFGISDDLLNFVIYAKNNYHW